ncbi:hypothetical protein, partial [Thiorhodococcus minor]|uniref:hypothetical protein n=1 Tax=Thiorhodococcus minor TaxID=57489 RepID=UPI001FD782FF
RRETRRQTENTNFGLNGGKDPAYSPIQHLVVVMLLEDDDIELDAAKARADGGVDATQGLVQAAEARQAPKVLRPQGHRG